MKIIIKYLKPYWKTVIVIALLLAVMAFCDLALPQYTSEIIDVGITNRGVDHILPEQILPEDYETARTFMTPEEAAVWEDSYEPSGESSALIRKAQKEEELDRRDAILQVPVLMNYMAASGMQPEADMAALRARVEAMEETMGSSLLFSMGSAYAAGCDKRAGMDMNHVQMAYMWRVGLKMLLITLLMLITPIMISYLASGVGASMGRNLRRQIFHKV
ncbi:MAG: ABC transporter ATP-binding protein, partial [Firmicutes bacterium]|nr:ABC transporter ATP-binding protein [Bacillota bacterium]